MEIAAVDEALPPFKILFKVTVGGVASATADVKKYQPAKGFKVSMVFPALSVTEGEIDTVIVLLEGIYDLGEVTSGVRVKPVLVDERVKYGFDNVVPDEKRVVGVAVEVPATVGTEVTVILPFCAKVAWFMAFVNVTVMGWFLKTAEACAVGV
jgi:hypothetical protein